MEQCIHVTYRPVGVVPRHRSRCTVTLERSFWRVVNHDIQAAFGSTGFVTVYVIICDVFILPFCNCVFHVYC
jgi:hypothetical protein